jgi:hypothetical protein
LANKRRLRFQVFFRTRGDGVPFSLQKFAGNQREIVTRSGCIEMAVIQPNRLRRIRRRFENDARYRVVAAKVV